MEEEITLNKSSQEQILHKVEQGFYIDDTMSKCVYSKSLSAEDLSTIGCIAEYTDRDHPDERFTDLLILRQDHPYCTVRNRNKLRRIQKPLSLNGSGGTQLYRKLWCYFFDEEEDESIFIAKDQNPSPVGDQFINIGAWDSDGGNFRIGDIDDDINGVMKENVMFCDTAESPHIAEDIQISDEITDQQKIVRGLAGKSELGTDEDESEEVGFGGTEYCSSIRDDWKMELEMAELTNFLPEVEFRDDDEALMSVMDELVGILPENPENATDMQSPNASSSDESSSAAATEEQWSMIEEVISKDSISTSLSVNVSLPLPPSPSQSPPSQYSPSQSSPSQSSPSLSSQFSSLSTSSSSLDTDFQPSFNNSSTNQSPFSLLADGSLSAPCSLNINPFSPSSTSTSLSLPLSPSVAGTAFEAALPTSLVSMSPPHSPPFYEATPVPNQVIPICVEEAANREDKGKEFLT